MSVSLYKPRHMARRREMGRRPYPANVCIGAHCVRGLHPMIHRAPLPSEREALAGRPPVPPLIEMPDMGKARGGGW